MYAHVNKKIKKGETTDTELEARESVQHGWINHNFNFRYDVKVSPHRV
jgi:hypothetical protein